MEPEGNGNGGTPVAFPEQPAEGHPGPFQVIRDNATAHRGAALPEYPGTPGLGLRRVELPGYSRDFNTDEAIWGRAVEG